MTYVKDATYDSYMQDIIALIEAVAATGATALDLVHKQGYEVHVEWHLDGDEVVETIDLGDIDDGTWLPSVSCTMAGSHSPHDMPGGRCPGSER